MHADNLHEPRHDKTNIVLNQPEHPRSLIRIHVVHLQTLLQVEKLKANSMDPDQTAREKLI
jgi:hypothetical protein